jgi:large conductance mechanosensitive channel
MGFLGDFKAFVMRGNVLDLAVGVIIGAAFGGITKSLVDDVMMPPIGLALGAVDFKEQYAPLLVREGARDKYHALLGELNPDVKQVQDANAERAKSGQPQAEVPSAKVKPTLDQMIAKGIPTLRYGLFINTIINFVFVAFGVFLVVKLMSKMQKKAAAAPPPGPTKSEELLVEIRDLLKSKPAR